MNGFRVRLSDFGPFPKINPIPVKDKQRQLDADLINLLIWMVAGSSQIVPRAYAVLDGSSASSVVLVAHGEIWNPDGTAHAPVPAYNAVGRYTLTYDAAYNDANGNSVAITLDHSLGFPIYSKGLASGTVPRRMVSPSINGTTINVDLRTMPTDAYVDGIAFLLIW